MADKALNTQKLKMWEEKLTRLDKEYQEVLVRRGEAMAMGDLRENAAFQMADEDASALGAQIEEVNRIIAKLQVELGIKAKVA